jgi:hypothetical protein
MKSMKRFLALFPLFGVALAGCDLINQATSTTILGGAIVASPDISLMNQFTVKSQAAALAYVGSRSSPTDTSDPTPILGADVSLSFAGNTVKLTEAMGDTQGLYTADSIHNPQLMFVDGQTYTFSATLMGQMTPHTGVIKAPNKLQTSQITTSPVLMPYSMNFPDVFKLAKNTDLTVTWPAASGNFAYVTVFRADPNNMSNPMQVFDSPPHKTAGDILKLVLGTPPSSITIPGATFSQDGAYAIVLVTMDNGTPDDTTFIGSPILAGSGAALILGVGNFMP